MRTETPLYNSRILKIYLEYLKLEYPHINGNDLLRKAHLTEYEVEDQAHWFTQNQVDSFHKILVSETGDPSISRKAGRYAVSSEALGARKQYVLGLMSVTTFYMLMEKLYPVMSRGATIKAKKLGSNKVEITSTPKPGVREKPYQCENRIGTFESVARWFTKSFARVEHPACFHRGDECCRYIITWDEPYSLIWKRLRNYTILISILAPAILFFLLPLDVWAGCTLLCTFLTMAFALYAGHLDRKELVNTVQNQGNAAKDLIDEMNTRYNNALLIQEIGQATSQIRHIEKLVSTVVGLMQKRLDFERGMIMLANTKKTRLVHVAGYGYTDEQRRIMEGAEFHLDDPNSKGIFVVCFREKRPYLINNMGDYENRLSERSLGLARKMGVEALICVPLVYEKESLGILAVDNVRSKRPLTQTDMNLILGVASQTAASIIEAIAFQRLQESEKKYRDLVENANSIILRMDTGGCITFFNEYAQRFFGYSEQDIVGRKSFETIDAGDDSAEKEFEKLVRSLQRDPSQSAVSEKRCRLSDGSYAWIAWTNRPIFDRNGKLVEILSIGNDLTELKLAAQEKRELEAQLQRAQKMEAVGTLAGGIAHDFNNILQAIFGYTQLLLMKRNSEDPDYTNLKAIERSAQRASELTKRLLIFSRKVETKLQPLDLDQEVVQVCKMLERTIPKMIDIELDLAGDLKVVHADSVQVEQIMMNLGVNARDAMPEGGKLTFRTANVTLDREYCRSHFEANPGEYVLLSVSDTGHGIDRSVGEHIFEPFFTTKETGKGTGLGLPVVYGIVKSHGGYLTFSSEPGKGSTFEVYFPVLKGVEPEEASTRGEDAVAKARGGEETILLVDDEESARRPAEAILSEFGFTVITAANGDTAVQLYRDKGARVDLVILDLIMPGMSGRQCLEQLLQIDPEAKVVIASGYSMDGTVNEAMEAGAKGFVMKPYEMNHMLEVVDKVLHHNGG